MTRIAVMQPYFLPYAGYFRLMCDVDAFVILDAVQFPRSGWVHRNRLRTSSGTLSWLTLPLARAPLQTEIRNLRFRSTAAAEIRRSLRRFPATISPAPAALPLVTTLSRSAGSPSDLIVTLLELARDALGLRTPIVRPTNLAVTPDTGRVGRLLALCRHFGASRYVNAPGGRSLYDPAVFQRHGIDLEFLPEYRGPTDSILQRLHDSTPAAVRREILENLR